MTKFKTYNQDNANPKTERTLIIIKPDGIQRSLIGEIIHRYERTGLKLVAAKFLLPSREKVKEHYNLDPTWVQRVGEKTIASYEKKGIKPPSSDPLVLGQNVLKILQDYITEGPVLAMVWQGMHAVGVIRKITGGTEPLTSDVGTIRGDLTIHSYQIADTDGVSVKNLVHASGSPAEADGEIALWFNEEEVIDYHLFNEAILYE